MELSFKGGRFVSSRDDLNYREVLDSFKAAKMIRIITYNISKNQQIDPLLDALKETDADVQIITNVPSRMNVYFNSPAGQKMRSAAQKNIQIYTSKLDPSKFGSAFRPYFNVDNHAKMVGTEDIVYIGSANYSNESANNIETGVIIEDTDFIQALYREFFDKVRDESLSYFDESFSAFRLFILSLRTKFYYHHRNLMQNVYADNHMAQMVTVFLNEDDLYDLYQDLEALRDICGIAEDTYDEESEDYNEELSQLNTRFDGLDIDWLQEVVSEGGSLYKLVIFNVAESTHDILEQEFSMEAYDEYLDEYVERAMNMTEEAYLALQEAFNEDATNFLAEIEKVLSFLDFAMNFTEKWKVKRVNPEIDNT